jgi:hypothetical protein
MIQRFLTALVFLTALASLSQASPAVTPVKNTKKAVAPNTAKPSAKQSDTVSDAEITKTLRAKLAKSKIAADKFTFHVQSGVVTFEGKTDVIQHKGTATRMAKTSGALAVINHIDVSEAAKEKAANNLAKGRRRAQIKRGDTVARSEAR